MLNVRFLEPADEAMWDAYVDAAPDGTLFHKTAWKRIVAKTFDYTPYYLLAENEKGICGVLPLFFVKSIFIGKALISTPFAVYGGMLASNISVELALFEASKKLSIKLGAQFIELRERSFKKRQELQTRDSLYVTFQKKIEHSEDAIFKQLPRETRRLIRRANDAGMTARFSKNMEDLDSFYDIYAASVRNLGTPVFPRELFENCLRELEQHADILLISRAGNPVAAVLTFYFRDVVLPYYGGSLPAERNPSPNNYMYWMLMREAGMRGYNFFDFGRSKAQTGAYNFKRKMGFQPSSLFYQYYMSGDLPLPNNNPTNPKFKMAIKAWQHLPLKVTKVLGPKLVKAFPRLKEVEL